jgi:hypothetical protein
MSVFKSCLQPDKMSSYLHGLGFKSGDLLSPPNGWILAVVRAFGTGLYGPPANSYSSQMLPEPTFTSIPRLLQ